VNTSLHIITCQDRCAITLVGVVEGGAEIGSVDDPWVFGPEDI
jgi:hypothetical protein